MREKAERWLKAAGGLDVLRASRPVMDEAGALAYGVIEHARLVVLRMTEEVSASGCPSGAWWDAVLPEYENCLASLERLVRCLDE